MSRTKDPKRLIAEILGIKPSAVPPSSGSEPGGKAGGDGKAGDAAAGAAGASGSELDDDSVADLIEVYFSLEEPAERDVAFDKLAAVQSETTSAFFVAMMNHDEDDYMRRAAAAELARRGHPEALKNLQEDLADNADPLAFEHALETLADIEGAKFVPVVASMWQDRARNSLQRRAAMSVFEVLDAPQAMAAFVGFIEHIADVQNFADDILEQAMAAFGRQEHEAAVPVLRRLQERMAAATWQDEDEKQEAIAFVGEGLALLV